MEEIEALIVKATAPDADLTQRHHAFGEIVRRFQDMAFGVAYALLGDFQLAEDAAQEAFIEAYRNLSKLQETKAFSSWLRQIVIRRCHRITRRKRPSTEPIEKAFNIPSGETDPAAAIAEKDLKERVLAAIRTLPEKERIATTLFYINGYSQKDIATFMDISIRTIKKQLHDSRKKLKERLVDNMVKDTLQEKRPSRDDQFVKEILFKAIREGEPDQVSELLNEDSTLIHAKDEQGRTPIESLIKGLHPSIVRKAEVKRKAIYDLLIQRGANPELHVSIALNDTDTVEDIIQTEPAQIEQRFEPSASYGNRLFGMRPLALAATFGRIEMMQQLIQAGAEVQADGNLALIIAVTTSEQAMELLIEHGAQVNPPPNASYSPLACACEWLEAETARFLLTHGADPNTAIQANYLRGNVAERFLHCPSGDWQHPAEWLWPSENPITPLFVALGTPTGYCVDWNGLPMLVKGLIEAGADMTRKVVMQVGSEAVEITPLSYALKNAEICEEDERHINTRKDWLSNPTNHRYLDETIEILRKHGAPE
ncbi:MAG: sigma-70 family RNA polymerase sigma factor [Candidatus Poribacteria bacterium]|nr:sigma-70 family RNA polymerase sigma factor [Candidatus Poribacteria bacterium]